MQTKRALICGVSGQDGAYLAKLLLEKGYEVVGSSRDVTLSSFPNLKKLEILKNIHLISLAVEEYASVLKTIRDLIPDEIYFLSGQSSVGLSFDQPLGTLQSFAFGVLNFLEAIRFLDRPIRFFNASSSEMFGNNGQKGATEQTSFDPRSPYAIAKVSAHHLVVTYRDSYGIYACNGILFNHESPLRHSRFVTQKIVATAYGIAKGGKEKLVLGNLDTCRDWGWAPEYVEAMWLMMEQSKAEDFVIATGESFPLSVFVERTFSFFNLDWRDFVVVDSDLYRPFDISVSRADPSKAKKVLGWSARICFDQVIKLLCEHQTESTKNL